MQFQHNNKFKPLYQNKISDRKSTQSHSFKEQLYHLGLYSNHSIVNTTTNLKKIKKQIQPTKQSLIVWKKQQILNKRGKKLQTNIKTQTSQIQIQQIQQTRQMKNSNDIASIQSKIVENSKNFFRKMMFKASKLDNNFKILLQKKIKDKTQSCKIKTKIYDNSYNQNKSIKQIKIQQYNQKQEINASVNQLSPRTQNRIMKIVQRTQPYWKKIN